MIFFIMFDVRKRQRFGSLQVVALAVMTRMPNVSRLILDLMRGILVVHVLGVVRVQVLVFQSVFSGNIDNASVFGMFKLRSGCQVVLLIVGPGLGGVVNV